MIRTRNPQSSSFSVIFLHHCRRLHHRAASVMAASTASLVLLQGKTDHFLVPHSSSTKMPLHSNYPIAKVSAFLGRPSNRTQCYYYQPHRRWPGKFNKRYGDEGDRNKARAFAPSLFRQLSCDSTEDASGKLENSRGFTDHDHHSNSSIGLHDRSSSEKVVVAVDVDEVLGNFLSALNMFIEDRYSSKHSASDYHVYEFFKIWNCTRDEADIRVHEFFKTSYFKSGIHPIPGARQTLQKLSRFCDLSVVTSRQNAIKDQTIEWIEKHYPGLFQEIHFGNHFSLEGQSRPKSDICRSLGAKILIDDNPRYAAECAEAGMMVLLFDYENSYPWSKTGSVSQHPLVTKVHNWKEVEDELLSWIVSAKL
ncbi:uncharacterized protein LOC124937517 [Impatiens glandulifera]|uniref:uncharacterized protein LOC124937517 n=1 Tax=Impatiens glandulifera TaxID=253017 RepID=UPI001FB08AB7|nr:uncharacterized protein LOC124937517 [Impatiens glandulifera]